MSGAWSQQIDRLQIDYITRKAVTGGEYEESFSGLGGLLGVNLIKHVKTQGVKA